MARTRLGRGGCRGCVCAILELYSYCEGKVREVCLGYCTLDVYWKGHSGFGMELHDQCEWTNHRRGQVAKHALV